MTIVLNFDFSSMPTVTAELIRKLKVDEKFEAKVDKYRGTRNTPIELFYIDHDKDNSPFRWVDALSEHRVAAALKNPSDLKLAVDIARQRAQTRAELVLDETTLDLDQLGVFVDDVTRAYLTQQLNAGDMVSPDAFEPPAIEAHVYQTLSQNIDEFIRPDQEHYIVYFNPETVYKYVDISLQCTIPVIHKFTLFGTHTEQETYSTGPIKDEYRVHRLMKYLANAHPEFASVTQHVTGVEVFKRQHLKNSLAAYPRVKPDDIWTERSEPFRKVVSSTISKTVTEILSLREETSDTSTARHHNRTLDEALEMMSAYFGEVNRAFKNSWTEHEWALMDTAFLRDRIWKQTKAAVIESFDEFFDINREYSIHTGPYDEATESEAWDLWMKKIDEKLKDNDLELDTLYDNNVDMIRTLWAQHQDIPWPVDPFIALIEKDCADIESRLHDFCESEFRATFNAEYLISSKRW